MRDFGDGPVGIDAVRVTQWFEENLDAVEAPLAFEPIAGGRSNMTYAVTDAAGRRWALRRPPLGKRLASAHDVAREYHIISALQGTPVPVPNGVGLCEEEGVGRDPFYVMDWVDGPILRGRADADRFPGEVDRRAIAERVVDTLIAIHDVDPDEVGLGELGRKEHYVARQLRRWHGQWHMQHLHELPLIDQVHDRLLTRIPEQGTATIVHGDYRLDNLILSDSGEVLSVLDWELCTLGDPLADVGLLLVYWSEPGDELIPLFEPVTTAPGFLSRDAVKTLYAERSGRSLAEVDFFVALGYWKLAIILEGVYVRAVTGQYGVDRESSRELGSRVALLAEASHELLAA